MIDQADEEKFKRLQCSSVTALACIAPVAYEDRRLHHALLDGQFQCIDATIERITRTPNSAQITLFVHNFGHKIDAVLFRPKAYMLRQFIIGERHYFYGRIDCKGGHCQMAQPTAISEVGTLVPKYRTLLRADVLRRVMSRYITPANLREEGLTEAIAQQLCAIHFPQESVAAGTAVYDGEALKALKFAELYDYMRQLQAKRRYFPPLYRLDGAWIPWADSLPFTLTDEQYRAIMDIAGDLSGEHAAKRMIVGDVGSGKTMVILAAVMIARPHRAVLMAPTTILANQLFEEANKFLPSLKTVLVTNKTKAAPLEGYDFIIGTHALLHRELPEAGVVMVDEQHRFGTAQRHALEKMISVGEKHPHFLQFSATPIPRTQAMIDSSHIDVSLITQTPFKKDIVTRVIGKADFTALLVHIKAELAQEHQVLIVYPLVEQSETMNYQSLDEARQYWERNFAGVHVTHGKDKEKEEVLIRFREEGSILLSTTVVEVGISLPRLSTVIIVGAERLGLSTLHQLRGRVSRTGLKGYCYLFTHQKRSDRLEAFTRTDNGFDIAALDLKFRKSGDLIGGTMQSGKKFLWVDMAEDEEIVSAVKKRLNQ